MVFANCLSIAFRNLGDPVFLHVEETFVIALNSLNISTKTISNTKDKVYYELTVSMHIPDDVMRLASLRLSQVARSSQGLRAHSVQLPPDPQYFDRWSVVGCER